MPTVHQLTKQVEFQILEKTENYKTATQIYDPLEPICDRPF